MSNIKVINLDNIHMCRKVLDIDALRGSPNSLSKLWGQIKCQMNGEKEL